MKKLIFILTVSANSLIINQLSAQEVTTKASVCPTEFYGEKTISGETLDKNSWTAAHNYLPIGSIVEIINLKNKKKVTVRINEEETADPESTVEVTQIVAKALDLVDNTLTNVKLRIISLGKSAISTVSVAKKTESNICLEFPSHDYIIPKHK
jgi:rare lipoprotein A